MRVRAIFGAIAIFGAVLPYCAHAQLSAPDVPQVIKPTPRPPYAMNYTDEAAQSLGIHDSRMDAFSLTPKSGSGMPFVRGGLNGKGPNLQIILKTN